MIVYKRQSVDLILEAVHKFSPGHSRRDSRTARRLDKVSYAWPNQMVDMQLTKHLLALSPKH